jgi:hypothetical protein
MTLSALLNRLATFLARLSAYPVALAVVALVIADAWGVFYG